MNFCKAKIVNFKWKLFNVELKFNLLDLVNLGHTKLFYSITL